jgi:hypothetical protein
VIDEVLDHVPFEVVSFCPTCAVPLIAGAAWEAGWPYSYCAALDEPNASPPVPSRSIANAEAIPTTSRLATNRARSLVYGIGFSPSEAFRPR